MISNESSRICYKSQSGIHVQFRKPINCLSQMTCTKDQNRTSISSAVSIQTNESIEHTLGPSFFFTTGTHNEQFSLSSHPDMSLTWTFYWSLCVCTSGIQWFQEKARKTAFRKYIDKQLLVCSFAQVPVNVPCSMSLFVWCILISGIALQMQNWEREHTFCWIHPHFAGPKWSSFHTMLSRTGTLNKGS